MNKLTKLEVEAREAYEKAVQRMDEQDSKIQALPEDVHESERQFHKELFESLAADVARTKETWERQTAIAKARRDLPTDDDQADDTASKPSIRTGREEPVYRADQPTSFFRDLYFSQRGDMAAAQRLELHEKQTRLRADVTTADPGAGVFVPPQYLSELWAELPRDSRPFADAIRKLPLTETGMTVTIPRLTTGTSVASQAGEAQAPSETDVDGTLLTVYVETIAGQQDLSIQAFERTMPGMDTIVFADLRAAYDSELDRQLLHGDGHGSNQHVGIDSVTGRNTTTWTTSTPTTAGFVPQVYKTISDVADGRKAFADLIVLHPRRGAWAASNLSSTFPLFQLGGLRQAVGTQSVGFIDNLAGLRVILDGNVSTLEGAGTNQDHVFIVRSEDLILMEGPIRARVLEQTLAGTLQIRLQLFAYSAFISGRQPEAIGEIVGTGLVAPTFA